jgi:NTP pyrophosphatase (non-canonical NTP hydrolase)
VFFVREKKTMSTIKDICERAHNTAVVKGWYEGEHNVFEKMALIHSEVSEAVEEARVYTMTHIYLRDTDGKPEGVPIELADAVIRICDLAQHHDIDLGAAIEQKMAFNSTRPHRHGGKLA